MYLNGIIRSLLKSCCSLLLAFFVFSTVFAFFTINILLKKTGLHTSSKAHTHTHTRISLLRNMRAGFNSEAGKAVVDSNLDLAGLGYFYFPQSLGGGGLKSSYKCHSVTSDHVHPHEQPKRESPVVLRRETECWG